MTFKDINKCHLDNLLFSPFRIFYLFEKNSKGHVTDTTDMLYSKQNELHYQ